MATKEQKTMAAVAGAAVIGIAALFLLGDKKKKAQRFFLPGATVDTIQGSAFKVRLPRGDYSVLGDEVLILSQVDLGVHTDLAVMVAGAPEDFTAQIIFVDDDDPTRQYQITLIARRGVPGA